MPRMPQVPARSPGVAATRDRGQCEGTLTISLEFLAGWGPCFEVWQPCQPWQRRSQSPLAAPGPPVPLTREGLRGIHRAARPCRPPSGPRGSGGVVSKRHPPASPLTADHRSPSARLWSQGRGVHDTQQLFYYCGTELRDSMQPGCRRRPAVPDHDERGRTDGRGTGRLLGFRGTLTSVLAWCAGMLKEPCFAVQDAVPGCRVSLRRGGLRLGLPGPPAELAVLALATVRQRLA